MSTYWRVKEGETVLDHGSVQQDQRKRETESTAGAAGS